MPVKIPVSMTIESDWTPMMSIWTNVSRQYRGGRTIAPNVRATRSDMFWTPRSADLTGRLSVAVVMGRAQDTGPPAAVARAARRARG